MDNCKRLLLGVVAVLSMLATSNNAYAVDASALGDSIANQKGTSASTVDKSSHKSATDINKVSTKSESSTSSSIESTNLVYGWNIIDNDVNHIYFADANGVLQKNCWVSGSQNWYHTDADGAVMRSKWLQDPDNGKWYYLGVDGGVVTGMNVDGYYLGADGSWQGNARASSPSYHNTTVDNTGKGATILSLSDFEVGVVSGTIKVRVDRSQVQVGGSSDSKSTGTLIFYTTTK